MSFSKDTPVNRLLLDLNITQTELSKIIGVERAHLCRVINGINKHKAFPTKYKLAKYFERPLEELFPEDAA